MKTVRFRDRAKVQLVAGNGGEGCVAFRREKFEPHGGPSGGDGGHGGSVYMRASKDVDSLVELYYQPIQKAEHGQAGMTKQRHGRTGKDLLIPVPCGTQVYNEEDGALIGEVLEDGDTLLLAKGGRGGLGNCHFATASHQTPRESTPGTPGESCTVRFELKSVAHAGLVGYPNAGKSTLLSKLTNATPKIAAYPFTTLNPLIGTLQFEDFKTLRLADIPGLIDGAHEGVGLGHHFLRHIERTELLVFVLDMAGVDGRNAIEDYRNLCKELALYSPDLKDRPRLIVANKMDVPEAAERLEAFKSATGLDPFPASAEQGEGVDNVKAALYTHFFANA